MEEYEEEEEDDGQLGKRTADGEEDEGPDAKEQRIEPTAAVTGTFDVWRCVASPVFNSFHLNFFHDVESESESESEEEEQVSLSDDVNAHLNDSSEQPGDESDEAGDENSEEAGDKSNEAGDKSDEAGDENSEEAGDDKSAEKSQEETAKVNAQLGMFFYLKVQSFISQFSTLLTLSSRHFKPGLFEGFPFKHGGLYRSYSMLHNLRKV